YRASNRNGKSTAGVAEDCAWLLGYRPWYKEGDPARMAGIPQGRPVKILVITTEWEKVGEVFTNDSPANPGKLYKYLPRGFIKKHKRNHSGFITWIECENGSSITFDTVQAFKTNPQGAESSDWDAIHVDEPCSKEQWNASSRGLIDRDGSAWFTLTPLEEFWINDMFFPDDMKAASAIIKDGDRERLWAISATIYENPYLTPAAIAEYESGLNDDEKQCRLLGIPLHLSGLIYKEFDSQKHILTSIPKDWKDYNKPPENYTIYCAIDPHPQTPHAVLFCAVSPFGQKFFYDEVFFHCTIDELCKIIKEICHGYFVARTRIDPMAYINDPITGSTMAQQFLANDIMVSKAPKDLGRGILKVKEELKKDNNIYISPSLRRFIWEINRYCWDKDNKPVDKDDHMMECFYRLCLENLDYIDPSTNRVVDIPEMSFEKAELSLDLF
ncbi:MAG TPA: hypothetical protein PKD57_14705, partial [Saprospiraceae bacterium]|nr:hypothetical protein [Saprospiraceae bacterium]